MGYCDGDNNINVEKLKKQCTQYIIYNNSNIYATIRLNNKIYIYMEKNVI